MLRNPRSFAWRLPCKNFCRKRTGTFALRTSAVATIQRVETILGTECTDPKNGRSPTKPIRRRKKYLDFDYSLPCTATCRVDSRRLFSTTQQERQFQVWQYPTRHGNDALQDRKTRGTLIYEQVDKQRKDPENGQTDANEDSGHSNIHFSKDYVFTQLHKNVLVHFLPANYPHSVAPGYMAYASYGFIASIAGSAAMVLSTQTLLLAVGVVGSGQNHQTASIMAGALNWVLKDGIGQFGGVIFASYLGKFQSLDVYPKHWRMVAAVTLDCATLLELLSPMVPTWFVLPIASLATIGKNIGFLTASASRAALHQSLAIRGNTLADVTVKAGSQSIAAGLIGTTFGIGLSSSIVYLSPDITNVSYYYLMGFSILAMVHQGCTYRSLQEVPIPHLNRHRLDIVLAHYLETDHVMSPMEVAPFDLPSLRRALQPHVDVFTASSSRSWLSIGSPLTDICGDSKEMEQLLLNATNSRYFFDSQNGESAEYSRNAWNGYILHCSQSNDETRNGELIHLVFWDDSTGEEVICGMMHAHLVRQQQQLLMPKLRQEELDNVSIDKAAVRRTQDILKMRFPEFVAQLATRGWKTGTEFTTVESNRSRRLHLAKV